jgi:thioredoxin-like negative regulator of GroEL
MEPIVNGLEEIYGEQVRFVRLDLDEDKQSALARKLGAFGHPVCLVVNARGQVVARFAGEVARAKLAAALDEVVKQ